MKDQLEKRLLFDSGKLFNDLKLLGIYLFVITLSLSLFANSVSIIISVLGAFGLIFHSFRMKKLKLSVDKIHLLMFLYHALLLIGFLYSSNIKDAFHHLEVKLSFIIFPLIFISRYDTKDFNKEVFLKCFTWSVVFTCLLNHSIIIFNFFKLEESFFPYISQFTYIKLSGVIGIHPTYYSVFISIAFFYLHFRKKSNHNFLQATLNLFVILYLLLFLVLLSSRIVLISVFTLVLANLLFKSTLPKRIVFFISLIALLIVLKSFILDLFPDIKYRITDPIEQLLSGDKEVFNDYRLEPWKCGVMLLNGPQILLGYGTGDVQDKLMECYSINQFDEGLRVNKNAHNEYLQTLLRNGIAGLSLLLLIIVFSIKGVVKNRSIRDIYILLLFTITFFTESMLSVQKGAVAFCFFFLLLTRKNIR